MSDEHADATFIGPRGEPVDRWGQPRDATVPLPDVVAVGEHPPVWHSSGADLAKLADLLRVDAICGKAVLIPTALLEVERHTDDSPMDPTYRLLAGSPPCNGCGVPHGLHAVACEVRP